MNTIGTTKKVVKKSEDRTNFLFCFIGTNRTGKSATAQSLAMDWKSSRPNGIIVAHDPQRRFVDIADGFLTPDDEDWAERCCTLRNALVILDDIRLIHESDRASKGLMKLLYHRADYNIDIIYIVHNPGLVINALAHFTSNYFIFMTNIQEGAFKKKIPNYSLCMAASEKVNKYVSIFGRGKYPKFPYVMVDIEKQRLIAVNMERDLTKVKLKGEEE